MHVVTKPEQKLAILAFVYMTGATSHANLWVCHLTKVREVFALRCRMCEHAYKEVRILLKGATNTPSRATSDKDTNMLLPYDPQQNDSAGFACCRRQTSVWARDQAKLQTTNSKLKLPFLLNRGEPTVTFLYWYRTLTSRIHWKKRKYCLRRIHVSANTSFNYSTTLYSSLYSSLLHSLYSSLTSQHDILV
jgi:hypothetical protein